MAKYYSDKNRIYQSRWRKRHLNETRHQSYRDETHMFIKSWANTKDQHDIVKWLKHYLPTDKRKGTNHKAK